jgi:hypothetical protein
MIPSLFLFLFQEVATGSVRAGNEALAAGDRAKAAAEYEAAIDRDPSSAIAVHNLGLVRLLDDRPQEAATLLERARAAGEGEARARAIYHLGHAFHRASVAAESSEEEIDRAIDFARAARDAFLDVLELRPDEDARANAEIAARRLAALEERKAQSSPESRPSSRPSEGEESGDAPPESESPPSEPETRPSEEPESRPASGSEGGEQDPASRPAQPQPAQPETQPAQPETRPAQPETRPASPESRPGEVRPPLSPEQVKQILDRLEESEKARQALEAAKRRRERVPVERDW